MDHIVNILSIERVTHDVKCFRMAKPAGYLFTPGQATDVSINKPGFEKELRPFTFTCLNSEPYLEFTIKRYQDHHGVTDQLHQLKPGDQLIIRDVWGAIEYKGPGYFIAGGAGITPFMAILRDLHAAGTATGNILFFSNKTSGDIIYEQELKKILGKNAVFVLTQEEKQGFQKSYINGKFIKQNIPDMHKHFYICGPDKMVNDIVGLLQQAGADTDTVVFEK